MLPWLVLLCGAFFLPTSLVLAWAPTQVGAGLVSILMLAELLLGTASAAIWASEPFGWREITGCTLILLASLVEVILPDRRTLPAPA